VGFPIGEVKTIGKKANQAMKEKTGFSQKKKYGVTCKKQKDSRCDATLQLAVPHQRKKVASG